MALPVHCFDEPSKLEVDPESEMADAQHTVYSISEEEFDFEYSGVSSKPKLIFVHPAPGTELAGTDDTDWKIMDEDDEEEAAMASFIPNRKYPSSTSTMDYSRISIKNADATHGKGLFPSSRENSSCEHDDFVDSKGKRQKSRQPLLTTSATNSAGPSYFNMTEKDNAMAEAFSRMQFVRRNAICSELERQTKCGRDNLWSCRKVMPKRMKWLKNTRS